MATLHFGTGTFALRGTGQGASLDGAITLAALVRRTGTTSAYEAILGGATAADAMSLMFAYDSSSHLGLGGTKLLTAWDGTVNQYNATTTPEGDTDWWLLVLTKGAGAAIPRFHMVNVTTGAAAIHEDGGGTNLFPSMDGGYLKLGNYDTTPGDPGSYDEDFIGDIAVVGWWDVAMTDAQVEALAANNRTSDWWLHEVGQPSSLTELTTDTPSDLSGLVTWENFGPATTSGDDPPNWTYGTAPSGTVIERLSEELAPIMSDDLATYIAAVSAMFAQVELYAVDQGDEWDRGAYSNLLDVDRAPDAALPYLAQFVGVTLPVGLTGDAARNYIRAQNQQTRGTPAAIMAAARLHLTGTQYVHLAERDSSAYHATLTVRTAEVVDSAALSAAVKAVKPAGVVIDIVESTGETWDEATHTWDTAPGTWESTLTTSI